MKIQDQLVLLEREVEGLVVEVIVDIKEIEVEVDLEVEEDNIYKLV